MTTVFWWVILRSRDRACVLSCQQIAPSYVEDSMVRPVSHCYGDFHLRWQLNQRAFAYVGSDLFGIGDCFGRLALPAVLPVPIYYSSLGSSHTGWHLPQHMVHLSSWAGFCLYS